MADKKQSFSFKEVRAIPDEWVKYIGRPWFTSDLMIGAFFEGNLVGLVFGSQSAKTERRFVISGMFIKEGFRRQGIGTRLIRRICWKARNTGFDSVEIKLPLAETKKLLIKEETRTKTKVEQKQKEFSIKKLEFSKAEHGAAIITFNKRMPRSNRVGNPNKSRLSRIVRRLFNAK